MFKNIIQQIKLSIQNFGTLEPQEKKKKIILGVIVLLIILIIGVYFVQLIINSAQNVGVNTPVTNDLRAKIKELGNPFGLSKTSTIVKYPFIINKKINDKLYLIDVNTSMLGNPYYDDLFTSDNNLRNSLESKPFTFIDTYQAIYDVDQDKTINPFQRITNFNIITLQGQDYWFVEEGEDYWLSKPNFEELRKVPRNTNTLSSFKKLVKVGPSKLVTARKGERSQNASFITLEIFPDATSRVKSSFVDFSSLYDVKVEDNFDGAFHQTTPSIYAFNANNIMHRVKKENEDIFVIIDITDSEKPKIIEKRIRIREKNNIFVTCSITKEKCWIYNPAVKTIVEVNTLADTANLNPLIDIDLTKITENTDKTFDDDTLIRFNDDTNEILFFYQESWKPLYRF